MKSLKSVAKKLAKAGRGGDTKLVHVNPAEIKALIAMGGSNTINPKTGLREFIGGASFGGQSIGGAFSSAEAAGSGGNQDDRKKRQKKQADLKQFNEASRGSVEPAGSKTNLSDTQNTIATGIKLAAGLIIPGGGLITGAAKALEFFFGPGSQPAFQNVRDFQGRAGGDFGRQGIERNNGGNSKAGKIQQAAQVTRSVNSAASRLSTGQTANVANPRVSQVAALSRRRGEAGTNTTVLTSLRGIVGGTGKAKKRALGV